MDSNPQLLFAIFLACIIVWQLAAGYTLGTKHWRREDIFGEQNHGKNWFTILFRAEVFRESNPAKYWFTILAEVVVLAIFLITGATSWEWSSSSDEEVVAATTPTRAELRRAEAFELHRKQQPAQAIAIYDELLQESGEDAEILYWRGMAHGRLGDLAAARADATRACELGKAEACNVAERLRAKL